MTRSEEKVNHCNRPRYLQIRLRTLFLTILLVAVLLAVWPAIQKYRSERIWRRLENARAERDAAQREWQRLYEVSLSVIPSSTSNAEAVARDRYFSARKKLEDANAAFTDFYGISGRKQIEITIDPLTGAKDVVPHD